MEQKLITYNKTEVIFEDLCKNIQLDQGNLNYENSWWKMEIINNFKNLCWV